MFAGLRCRDLPLNESVGSLCALALALALALA